MPLNISNGNMYDFITHTWNTIKGECEHNCSYCYMKRWGKQNLVRFDEKELKTDLSFDNFIFVVSSNDMFSDNLNKDWIIDTLIHCNNFDNSYLFQSKNVARMVDFRKWLPKRTVICTTIETNRYYPEIMNNSPKPYKRSFYMGLFKDRRKYVTVEPIMDFDLVELVNLIKNCDPEQVNIGADTGNNKLPEPPKEKIFKLVSELNKFTKVHLKKNLNRIIKTK